MGFFRRNDWNVIGIMFETLQKYQVNGNRGKGPAAETIRDNVKRHKRTIYWAVFDQKRAFLEGEPGPACHRIPNETRSKLIRDLPKLQTIQEVLTLLEEGKADKTAKALAWIDYPPA